MSETNLLTFRAISNFMNELGELFGDKQHSLKLYCRLINKTTISHTQPIEKHIEAFRRFCVENRDSILEKNVLTFSEDKISYSERVFVNIASILKSADSETTNAIWKHLLTISARVDPAANTKEIMKLLPDDDINQTPDLSNLLGTLGAAGSPLGSLLNSDLIKNLVGGLSGEGGALADGGLDLQKLVGTVQSAVSTMQDTQENQEMAGLASNFMKTMMDGISGGENSGADLMSMISPVLENLSGENGLDLSSLITPEQMADSSRIVKEVMEKVSSEGLPDKLTESLPKELTEGISNMIANGVIEDSGEGGVEEMKEID